MDSNLILGLTFTAIVCIFGFLWSFKKAILSNREPIEKLNESIIKLTATIDQIFDKLKILDTRVTKHGGELDQVKDRVLELEHKQVHYETLLESINKRLDKIQNTLDAM